MAELISALADAKIDAAEIQALLREKDEEIKRLKNLLEGKSLLEAEHLPNESIKILKLLSNVSEPVFLFHISQTMQLSLQKTKYFLEKLEKIGFVDYSNLFWEQDETYFLNEKGRKYLFENL